MDGVLKKYKRVKEWVLVNFQRTKNELMVFLPRRIITTWTRRNRIPETVSLAPCWRKLFVIFGRSCFKVILCFYIPGHRPSSRALLTVQCDKKDDVGTRDSLSFFWKSSRNKGGVPNTIRIVVNLSLTSPRNKPKQSIAVGNEGSSRASGGVHPTKSQTGQSGRLVYL